jgi:glycosyltransferase involved in cell wall biosynthesis
LIDGAPINETRTEDWIKEHQSDFPFQIKYFRHTGGTAVQRNFGVERAEGDLIAFFDDDVRPEPAFLSEIVGHFEEDKKMKIGGITGYKKGHYFEMKQRARWRWYKKLNLLSTFTPSAYDRKCGYPINAGAQPPFKGLREVDIMTGACTVYRKEVFFEHALRFHPFFRDYGMLEDNHLALSVQKASFKNMQCGDSQCEELNSPAGRSNGFVIGAKTCLNYYFVFNSICGPLDFASKWRFFRFQFFELIRSLVSVMKKRDQYSLAYFSGKLHGIWTALFLWERHVKHILHK